MTISDIKRKIEEQGFNYDDVMKCKVECFLPIEGCNFHYVSNFGRVKSDSTKCHRGTILKPFKNLKRNGYWYYCFTENKKIFNFSMHRLVLKTFSPIDGYEKLHTNHIDEDKDNNKLTNLNWMTPKENNNWGTKNERQSELLSKKHFYQCDLEGNIIREWRNTVDVEKELKYRHSNILNCLHKKMVTYKNYRWIYKEDYEKEKEITFKKYDRGTRIIQRDLLTNEIIKEYLSAIDIRKELGYDDSYILKNIKKNKPCYGYKWERINLW